MKEQPICIQRIVQKDNHTLTIGWSDGVTSDYRLSLLQKNCPCAGCSTESVKNQVKDDVRATKISSVGRYALRISFTHGCSAGIYDFSLLRNLGKE